MRLAVAQSGFRNICSRNEKSNYLSRKIVTRDVEGNSIVGSNALPFLDDSSKGMNEALVERRNFESSGDEDPGAGR